MANESAGASGLAERYATALFELAEADGRLDAVAADLKNFGALMDASPDLARLIRSPITSRTDKENAVAAVAEKAGFDDLTRRFLGTLARNRRLFVVRDVAMAYLGQLAAGRGETTAEVASAAELSDAQMDSLRAALKKAVGGDVAVHTRVDPGLLGGLVVKVGSRMVDSSLRTKIQQLRLAMKGIG